MNVDSDQSVVAFTRAATIETSMTYMGSIVSFLVNGADAGGRFALVQVQAKPGNEPPPHIHEREHELYYVLDGLIEFHCAKDTFRAKAGDICFIPRGTAHAMYVLSPSFSSLVMVASTDDRPVGLDRYFSEMGEPARTMDLPSGAETHIMADPSRVIRIAEANGTHILTPEETAAALPNYPGFGKAPR